jgi:hypothetical protein
LLKSVVGLILRQSNLGYEQRKSLVSPSSPPAHGVALMPQTLARSVVSVGAVKVTLTMEAGNTN